MLEQQYTNSISANQKIQYLQDSAVGQLEVICQSRLVIRFISQKLVNLPPVM